MVGNAQGTVRPVARIWKRRGALIALWQVWQASQKPGAPSVGELFKATPRMLGAWAGGRYRGISTGRVLAMLAATGYLVSPIDLVPEGLFAFVGLVDDAAVAAWLAGVLLDETSRFAEWERLMPPAAGVPEPQPRGSTSEE
jgi:uncharacterized membrane protein YkvA (DUF1232 family)